MTKRTRQLAWFGLVVAAVLLGLWAVSQFGRRRRAGTIDARIDRYRHIIRRHARANELPVELVRAVIRVESAGKARAVSSKNAKGLMQITPITQREVHRHVDWPVGDLFDPDYNILLGTTYLRQLLNRFGGDAHLALAGYHLGPTRLQRLCNQHPDLDGRQLIEKHAPRITARYCKAILGHRQVHLPVVPASRHGA